MISVNFFLIMHSQECDEWESSRPSILGPIVMTEKVLGLLFIVGAVLHGAAHSAKSWFEFNMTINHLIICLPLDHLWNGQINGK